MILSLFVRGRTELRYLVANFDLFGFSFGVFLFLRLVFVMVGLSDCFSVL